MNNLICYTPETEPRIISYDAMNKAKTYWGLSRKLDLREANGMGRSGTGWIRIETERLDRGSGGSHPILRIGSEAGRVRRRRGGRRRGRRRRRGDGPGGATR